MFFRFLAEHCGQVEMADHSVSLSSLRSASLRRSGVCACKHGVRLHKLRAASGSDRVLARRIRLSEVTGPIRLNRHQSWRLTGDGALHQSWPRLRLTDIKRRV